MGFRKSENEKRLIWQKIFDRYGFISKAYVLVSEQSYLFRFNNDQIEQIAKHEVGHVLGLGNANFGRSLMAIQIDSNLEDISTAKLSSTSTWSLELRRRRQY